jgi:hypothetical protein
VHRADNLTIFICRLREIWKPELLELQGPVQACNGTALLVPLPLVEYALKIYICSYDNELLK